MKWLRVLALVAVLAMVLASPMAAMAQAGPGDSPVPTPEPTVTPAPEPGPVDPGDIPELPALLQMLAGPQGWVVLGVLVSMLLAKWAWYNALRSDLKQALFVGAVAVLSIGAHALITYIPVEFWQASAPIWQIVAGVVMTWIGGNAWYALGVKPNRDLEQFAEVGELVNFGK